MPVSGFPAGLKSGWAILQPIASLRPVMTKRSCTPPSLVRSGLRLKRASLTGPFSVTNQGTTLFAPLSVATAIKGFCAGLVPPGAGCAWHERHWLELKRGPSPLFEPPCTTSTSMNLAAPSWKKALSSAVRLLRGSPAPAAPPRTPGSTGFFAPPADMQTVSMANTVATKAPNTPNAASRPVIAALCLLNSQENPSGAVESRPEISDLEPPNPTAVASSAPQATNSGFIALSRGVQTKAEATRC